MPPRPLKTRLKRYALVRRLAPPLRRLAARLSPAAVGRTARWAAEIVNAIRRRRRERRLTVAVDVLPLWEPLTGVGWYLLKLLEALSDRDDLRLRLYGLALVDLPEMRGPVVPLPVGPALERVAYPLPGDLVLPRRWLLPLLRRLEPLLLAADGNRVVFAPNFILPPPFALAGAPLVATVHDLGIRRLPWAVRDDTREAMLERLDRTLFQAKLLITPSAAVRDDLALYGDADPARVRVIHHGLGQAVEAARRAGGGRSEPVVEGDPAAEPAPPAGTPDSFALCVGTLEPRKNLPTLIAARRLLARRGAPPERAPALVLAGRYGWQTAGIRSAVEEAAAEGWLIHFGYVSQEELVALYRRARLVALPSLYEGFGLPAVEAMWAGAPLLLSDIPVFHEVAGDAALYAPPDRPEIWADRLAELAGDEALRRELIARGRERARAFTWERAAELTARALAEAAG
jgi:glycosyltransferase involved in cell wall biosynthesis